jgi:hypothetical protein
MMNVPQEVVEHGCGFYSTPILKKALHYRGYESDKAWAEVMDTTFCGKDMNPRKVVELNFNIQYPLDLLFIDGEASSREEWLRFLLPYTRLIAIWHDTEDKQYGYHKVGIPDDFNVFRVHTPCKTDFGLRSASDSLIRAFVEEVERGLERYEMDAKVEQLI